MTRLDAVLIEKKLYPSRTKAATAIKSNLVFVNGAAAVKPGRNVSESDSIDARPLPYASGRGNLKLGAALDSFGLNPKNFTCLDVGASTGGFTEALLSRGASKIIAVDVGTNQMIDELKSDPRVMSLENTDIRDLVPIEKIDLAVIDVSFISLPEIIKSVAAWAPPAIIALIKPEFEVPRAVAAKCGGVIKNDRLRAESVRNAANSFEGLGFKFQRQMESPIKGGSGNTEYLALFIRTKTRG